MLKNFKFSPTQKSRGEINIISKELDSLKFIILVDLTKMIDEQGNGSTQAI